MGSVNHAGASRHLPGFVMAAAFAGILCPSPVTGQEPDRSAHPALQDRWALELGAYMPKIKTSVTLNNATLGRGTSLSFEDELGLSDREVMGTFLARMRLGERWRLEAEYFSLDRSGSRAINRTIDWGGNVYTAGTVVTSGFNSDIYRLSGGYSFIRNTRYEFGGTFGLHVTDFTASIAAAGVGAKGGDALAPLPTVGMYGAYAFTSKWLLSGRVDYFSLKYDAYDGSLKNAAVGIDYRFHRNFGAGLGYRYVDYTLEATKASFTGEVRYQFSGPLLYAVASF